ncbi:MAG: hypothetical protein K2N12_00620 [Helicobacter sp.]|nr:hypothetical protein [Helicobacter sp.]
MSATKVAPPMLFLVIASLRVAIHDIKQPRIVDYRTCLQARNDEKKALFCHSELA